jgi:hypothetical protein
MAAGLAPRFAVIANQDFQNRVSEAVTEAALNIYAEAGATAGHVARAAYATVILNDMSNRHAILFAQACAAQGLDDTAATTDAQIAGGVAAAWNALAGA